MAAYRYSTFVIFFQDHFLLDLDEIIPNLTGVFGDLGGQQAASEPGEEHPPGRRSHSSGLSSAAPLQRETVQHAPTLRAVVPTPQSG
jgi:hypothetical protein